MTISTETRKVQFTGNGVAVDFAFAFKVFAAADLYVVKTVESTGAETVLVLDTDYTVTLSGDQNVSPGGTVTLPVALASGYLLTITTQLAYTQGVDLTNNGGFFPRVISDALDRITMLVQQGIEGIGRSLKYSVSTPAGVSSELPYPAAYKVLAWKGDLSGLENVDPSGSGSLGSDLSASSGSSLVGFLQAGTGAVARTAQDKMRDMVSVFDFMTTAEIADVQAGTLLVDVTAAIQAAIDSTSSLWFPPGKYLITSTLNFPTAAPYGGGSWKGAGGLYGDPRTTTRSGQFTALVWGGAAGGTMIVSDGVVGMEISQMCFVGQTTAGGASQAAILWHIQQDGAFGSGEFTFTHCVFMDAVNGVKCATLLADGGCAGINFIKPYFYLLTRGLYVVNSQGLNFTLHHLTAGTCTHVVDMEAGGNLFVYGGNVYGCGGTGVDDYPFRLQALGDNIAGNIIDGVRVEQNTKRFLQAKGVGFVHVRGLTEAQADQNYTMFDIRGSVVVVEASRIISNDATESTFELQNHTGSQRCGLVLRDCHLHAATWTQGDWIGLADTNDEVAIKIENCRYGDNLIWLPIIGNKLEQGLYTGFVQTTSNPATNVYFDGSGTNAVARQCRIQLNSLYILEIHYTGRQSDGSVAASFVRRATIKDIAGTTSLVGSLETIGTDVNASGWAVGLDVQNSYVRPTVTGALSTTIDWRVTVTPKAIKVV